LFVLALAPCPRTKHPELGTAEGRPLRRRIPHSMTC
jgi:hypothetical protein